MFAFEVMLQSAAQTAVTYNCSTAEYLKQLFRRIIGKKMTHDCTFLIVGGGIAGVSCAEATFICCPNASIVLLTESSVVKSVTNLVPVARYLHKFDVREQHVKELRAGIGTVVDQLAYINSDEHWVRTKTGLVIHYRYLCLCTGGAAKLITTDQDELKTRIIGIRDTDSVVELQRRLANAKDVLILGNGGIASELAHELHDVQVHWVIRDAHISATFVDPGAAEFFQLAKQETDQTATASTAIKRMRYSELLPNEQGDNRNGAALGPDWHHNYVLSGCRTDTPGRVMPKIYYKSQIDNLKQLSKDSALCITLKRDDGSLEQLNCDFIVSATGVQPRHDYETDQPLQLAADGGIQVDEMMRTNLSDIYAAGDVCTAGWANGLHWFQMRLWTQARQMGAMAGRSMAATHEGDTIYQDFCFELFGHVTQLFGFPVVLLGRYNGQELGQDYELLVRCTRNKEYIKFVLQNGRLRGAILIGNTDLAETCENLILNGTDLTPYGDDILNPDIDIEDYFD